MASKSTSNDDYGSLYTGGSGNSGLLTGSAYDYSSSYGGKPETADPSSSAAAAISGTSGNLASLYNLSSSYNTAAAQQANEAQNILTPGYSGNMSKWATDISDLLSGKVSSGTKYSLQQAAAERGISTGTSGSQNSDSAYLRALGLTSEGLQATGASQLASMIGSSPKINSFDMSQYLTTAEQQQAAQQYANTVASAASPAASASAATGAAQSGLNTGLSAAGSTPSTSGGTSSIAALLSSILGTGSGSSGAGTIVGTSNNGITEALNSILGEGNTYNVTGNTGVAGWDSQPGYDITGGAQDYYGDTGYSDIAATGE